MKMKLVPLAAALSILLMLFTASACAASAGFEMWVSPTGDKTADAIKWYKSGNTYYLFLPGNTDAGSLRVGFSGAESIKIDDKRVMPCAENTFLTPGKSVKVTAGKKTYTVKVMQGSQGLPALYITTESGSLTQIHKNKANKESGALVFVEADGKVGYDGKLTHIKMRGNSSTTFAKKNYQIKLSSGANLCGMGKSRTWILTGNYRDKSMLRNQITYDLAAYGGLPYTPEHISAEVYINNEYMGLYLFSEKVMIDDDRIAINDLENATEALNEGALNGYPLVGTKKATPGRFKAYRIPNEPEDITGGYLLEFETYSTRYKEEASSYYTTRKNTLVVKSPEYCSENQMAYITGFMQSFENAIFSPDGIDPDTGKHYSELIDMDSLVAKYLVEEISKNYDGNNSSMFFFKPADSQSTLAFAGPAWDYDSAYGSYAREDNAKKVLTGDGLWIAAATGAKYWWPALYKQPDFYARVTDAYAHLFRGGIRVLLGQEEDPQGLLKPLNDYADQIRSSVDMTLVRWPRQKNGSTVAKTGYTFDENISFLHRFLETRMAFLDQLWMTDGD